MSASAPGDRGDGREWYGNPDARWPFVGVVMRGDRPWGFAFVLAPTRAVTTLSGDEKFWSGTALRVGVAEVRFTATEFGDPDGEFGVGTILAFDEALPIRPDAIPPIVDVVDGVACRSLEVRDDLAYLEFSDGTVTAVESATGRFTVRGRRLSDDRTTTGSPVVVDGGVCGIIGTDGTRAFGNEFLREARRQLALPGLASFEPDRLSASAQGSFSYAYGLHSWRTRPDPEPAVVIFAGSVAFAASADVKGETVVTSFLDAIANASDASMTRASLLERILDQTSPKKLADASAPFVGPPLTSIYEAAQDYSQRFEDAAFIQTVHLLAAAVEAPEGLSAIVGVEPAELRRILFHTIQEDGRYGPSKIWHEILLEHPFVGGRVETHLVDPTKPIPSTGPPQVGVAVFDADVQFTVYRPRIVASERWYQLLAFAHKTTPSENEGDASDPLKEVARQAAQALGAQSVNYGPVAADSSAVLRRGNELVFEPWLEVGRVEPNWVALTWNEPVHHVPFRFQVPATREGGRVAGGLRVFGGPLLLGEMNFQFTVNSATADPPDEPQLADTVRRYRRIFASYSHNDADLVRVAADFARLSGDEYLIDSQSIRSGEAWERRLEELIEEADIFQLFWSHNSMRSEFVRREWEYALGLGREEFIRPVFWQDPLPMDPEADLPPAELLKIHFHALPTTLAALADEAHTGAAAVPTVSSPMQSTEVPAPPQAPPAPPQPDSAIRRLPGAAGSRASEPASICFSCGAPNPRDRTFCKRCGTRLAPEPTDAMIPGRARGLHGVTIVALVAAVGIAAVILTLLIAR